MEKTCEKKCIILYISSGLNVDFDIRRIGRDGGLMTIAKHGNIHVIDIRVNGINAF